MSQSRPTTGRAESSVTNIRAETPRRGYNSKATFEEQPPTSTRNHQRSQAFTEAITVKSLPIPNLQASSQDRRGISDSWSQLRLGVAAGFHSDEPSFPDSKLIS
ncbi:hypothetical protein ON010_g11957 [Phytophthora cinnamomi]|nr:hypothetical protein ON010_g11957 [Phytophthora cinnamomi]